jgi:hypothetical protein
MELPISPLWGKGSLGAGEKANRMIDTPRYRVATDLILKNIWQGEIADRRFRIRHAGNVRGGNTSPDRLPVIQ